MKSPLVRALPALALLAAPAAAHDDEGGYYFEFGAGLVSTDNADGVVGDVKFDTGYAVDLVLGHEWHDPFEAGLDFSLEVGAYFNEQNFDSDLLGPGSATPEQLSNGGFHVGGVVSWPYSEEISFYGGLGAGMATSLDLDSKSDAGSDFGLEDESALFFAGKLGVRYDMGGDTAWFFQYRRTMSEEIEVADTFLGQQFDLELDQNIFEVGVRWGL
ncbi:MAG: outer membrane beta-barrel protein [Planctomycetota bacterium]